MPQASVLDMSDENTTNAVFIASIVRHCSPTVRQPYAFGARILTPLCVTRRASQVQVALEAKPLRRAAPTTPPSSSGASKYWTQAEDRALFSRRPRLPHPERSST